jgi:hypothetical protein
MNSNKISLIVFSCDAYSDLWNDFFRFMNIYWEDKPYDVYLVNNSKHYEAKGVKVINAGDGDWSTRTRIALEQINTPYVMPFLEDYFVSEKIDTKTIKETLSFIESERIDYYQLNIEAKKDYPKWSNYKGVEYLFNIPKDRNYWVDTSISIWNKNFFLELLGKEDYSAWKFELDRNEDAKHPERYADRICIIDSRRLVEMCPMVIQGKYYPLSLHDMQSKGHSINTSNRQVMTSIEVMRYKLKRAFASIPFGHEFFKVIGRKLGYVFMSDMNKNRNKQK